MILLPPLVLLAILLYSLDKTVYSFCNKHASLFAQQKFYGSGPTQVKVFFGGERRKIYFIRAVTDSGKWDFNPPEIEIEAETEIEIQVVSD